MTREQPVPASAELELAFLASALLSDPGDGLRHTADVTSATFTRPTLGACFTAIQAAWQRGEMADPILVASEACAGGQDATPTLMALLGAMAAETSASWYLRQRAEALAEMETRRALMAFGSDTIQSAATTSDVRGLIAYTARYTDLLDTMRAREETGTIAEVADRVEAEADSGRALGLSSGIPDYDDWSGGLRRGAIHVVGGPPKAGKTWVGVQIANTVALAGERVALFSLEMSKEALYVRLIANRIGLHAYRLMGNGRTWTSSELDEYRYARSRLEESGLRMFTRQRSLADISAVVRQWQPRVVIVDYVQLMECPPGASPGFEAATENATGLQTLAAKADCTVVMLTQLSRESMRGGNTGAYMGGMMTGRIDQVADFGLLMKEGDLPGTVQLIARMNRHGVQGGSATYRLDAASGKLVRA